MNGTLFFKGRLHYAYTRVVSRFYYEVVAVRVLTSYNRGAFVTSRAKGEGSLDFGCKGGG